KLTISALLSRVYLYKGEWEKSETQSSLVINHTGLYSLPSIEGEFLKSSSGAILQLETKMEGYNTKEAETYFLAFGPPPLVALHENLLGAMEDDDLRRTHWIGEVTDGTNYWYYRSEERRVGKGCRYGQAPCDGVR